MEFLRVPYDSVTENANFTLLATIQGLSASLNPCEEARYITSLRFAGAWLRDSPLDVALDEGRMTVLLGGAQVKPKPEPIQINNMLQVHMPDEGHLHVGIGATWIDVTPDVQPVHFFLNLQARSLGSLGSKIGGILGEDAHNDVSAVPQGCHVAALLTMPRAARHFHAAASYEAEDEGRMVGTMSKVASSENNSTGTECGGCSNLTSAILNSEGICFKGQARFVWWQNAKPLDLSMAFRAQTVLEVNFTNDIAESCRKLYFKERPQNDTLEVLIKVGCRGHDQYDDGVDHDLAHPLIGTDMKYCCSETGDMIQTLRLDLTEKGEEGDINLTQSSCQ
jgi:hypothetical protein